MAASAHAYQTARIGASGATVFSLPDVSSSTVGTLPRGAAVNVGDRPTQGFYRCTGAHGISGWVSEDSIVLPRSSGKPASPSRATQTSASSGPGFYGGLLAGTSVNGGSFYLSGGLDAGLKIGDTLGVGVYGTYTNLGTVTTTIAGTGAAAGTNVVGATSGNVRIYTGELSLFLSKEFHLEGKAGFGQVLTSTKILTSADTTLVGQTLDATASGIALGGGAGYDLFLSPNFSVGAESSFIVILAGETTAVINGLAALKVWF